MRLVSVGPDLHPRQRHREGRVSRRLRRAWADLRRARHQPARRRTCPTTRGLWDFGQGAGFYVDATEEPWADELSHVDLCRPTSCRRWSRPSSRSTWSRQAITGHSMGGHGALTVALSYPGPLPQRLGVRADRRAGQVPWGQKALAGYLGDDRAAWRKHDAVALIEDGARVDEILVDVGDADPFIEKELRPELLERACADGRHRADAAPPAGVRPQLLFHLDVHGRSFALARGEIAKGIGDDAQPPRLHSTGGGDGRVARVGRPGPRVAHQVARAARALSRRRRVGRSRSAQRHPVDPPAVRRRASARC